MYSLILAIEENEKIIGKVELWKIAPKFLVFALLNEWSNFIKKQIESIIAKGDLT